MYIPDYLFSEIRSPITIGILVYLISVADDDGNIYMSYADIGNTLGYERTRVFRHIQKLESIGVIELLTSLNAQQRCNNGATMVQQRCNKKRTITICNISTYKKGATTVQQWCNSGATVVQQKAPILNTQKEADSTIYSEDKIMNAAIAKWLSFKREKRQTYKPQGLKSMISRLAKLSNGDGELAMAIVEQSMSNNYAGLFPLNCTPSRTEQQLHSDGVILHEGQMDVTKGGW